MAKKGDKKRQPDFHSALAQVIRDFDGIFSAYRLSIPVLESVARKKQKEFSDFLQEVGATEKPKELRLTPQQFSQLRTHLVEHGKTFRSVVVGRRSLLFSLVSQFDAFFGLLLKALFLARPEIISGLERSFKLSEVDQFKSVDEIRNDFIEREIESVLRKSHTEQFEWLEKKLDIPLRKDLEAWPKFIEITERRNLYAHTDGVISRQYLGIITLTKRKGECTLFLNWLRRNGYERSRQPHVPQRGQGPRVA